MTEPIDVEATMRADLFEPRAFLWDGKRHVVQDLGRRWIEQGQRHWLVRTEANVVFELIYNLEAKQWLMGRTPTDLQPRGPVA